MKQRRNGVRALTAFPVRYPQANRAAQTCEANVAPIRGREIFGIAFTDVDGYQRG
jgi:hypothetical protein